METIEYKPMDPVLKQLLEDLPHEDPDKEWVYVWCPWTEGRHRVPVGETTEVNFGEWHGPSMRTREVRVFWSRGEINIYRISPKTIDPGDNLTIEIEMYP